MMMSTSQSLNVEVLTDRQVEKNAEGLTAYQALQSPSSDERSARVALQRLPKHLRQLALTVLYRALLCLAKSIRQCLWTSYLLPPL